MNRAEFIGECRRIAQVGLDRRVRLRIPAPSDQSFRWKVNTDSDAKWSVIPAGSGSLFGTHRNGA